MIIKLNKTQTGRCLQRLRTFVGEKGPWKEAMRLNLAGIQTVSVVSNVDGLTPLLRRQLDWSIAEYNEEPNRTVFIWEEPDFESFLNMALGLKVVLNEDFVIIVSEDGGKVSSTGVCNVQVGFFSIWDEGYQYYCVRSTKPEDMLQMHLFALNFSRIVDTPISSMVHGACVGIDGTGVLLCARGGRGKSTLTASALFCGFDYVSDDYLILKKEGESLLASPIYSSISLTPYIYNLLYDSLGPSKFIGLNGRLEKYMLDISGWRSQARWNYPVRACVFPEIASVPEPEIFPCTPQERGKAITHIVHSTIEQALKNGNSLEVRKLLGMLSGLPFYRIVLSPDLFRNVECLREFVKQLSA